MADEQINAALADLRQAFGDVGLPLSIVVDLRRNADQLLVPLAGELRRVRAVIDDTLGSPRHDILALHRFW